MSGRLWLSVAAAAALGNAASARASSEVVELRYAAPDGCPTRRAVESAILERTANVRFATPGRRVFAITIKATDDGFRGTLEIDQAADKELAAQHCEDLANAFALVTALAIDPMATVLPRPVPLPPAQAALRQGPGWVEVDLDAMVDAGVGPVAMFAAVVEARMRWRDAYQLELAAIAGRDSKAEDGGEARFTWLAARPAVCRRWSWHDQAIDGCGHVEVGAVRAAGEQIVNQRDLTRLWLAAGAHAGLGVPLGQSIFARLQLGASVPLVRDRYIFAPNVAIHDTPLVTGWLVLGLGMQFR
jgi:hypothetical protein